jgi:hypothetical protein
MRDKILDIDSQEGLGIHRKKLKLEWALHLKGTVLIIKGGFSHCLGLSKGHIEENLGRCIPLHPPPSQLLHH